MSMRMNSGGHPQQQQQPQHFTSLSNASQHFGAEQLGLHGIGGTSDLSHAGSYGFTETSQRNNRLLAQMQLQQQQQQQTFYSNARMSSPSPPLHGRYTSESSLFMRGGVL